MPGMPSDSPFTGRFLLVILKDMTMQPPGYGESSPPVPPVSGPQVPVPDSRAPVSGFQVPAPGSQEPPGHQGQPSSGAGASMSPYAGAPLPGQPSGQAQAASALQAAAPAQSYSAQPGQPGVQQSFGAVPAQSPGQYPGHGQAAPAPQAGVPASLQDRLASDFAAFERSPFIIIAWGLLGIALCMQLFGYHLLDSFWEGDGEVDRMWFTVILRSFLHIAIVVSAAIPFFRSRTRGNSFAAAAGAYGGIIFLLDAWRSIMAWVLL